MTFRAKNLPGALLVLFFFGAWIQGALADPFANVAPSEELYQRVKKLEAYGLLDAQDQAVLDAGKPVTRLELAFYTEKAKARLEAPQLAQPQLATPTPQPMPSPVISLPTPLPTQAPALVVPPGVKQEIEDLLKQLRDESVLLKSRLSLDDERIKDQEAELDKLKTVQDEVDEIWKKANKSSGIPNLYTNINMRVENLSLSGPLTQENATRILQEVYVGTYSDLGGKGTLSAGIGALIPLDGASASYQLLGVGTQPVSIYIGNPSVTFFTYGDLGRWDTTFAVETYQPDTSFGSFSRGFANYAIKRFEDPFDIKNFNDDKNAKNWDDYMNQVSYIPAYSISAGNVQSANDRVFDGMYLSGKEIPWLAQDGRMWVLVGRMGTSPAQTQRWEEGAKIKQPWANGLVTTSVSTEWVNDNFGVNPAPGAGTTQAAPDLNLKDYEAEVKVDLSPFTLDLDGGFSSFWTGVDTAQPNTFTADLKPVEAGAFEGSLAFYPFTVYGFAISDDYADFQSRVTMSGLNFSRYGLYFSPSDYNDAFGSVGEVDNLQSDRYGWRVNFGWDGRKQDWMKSWPSFLDTFVVNFDYSQKTEYTSEVNNQANLAYNEIEPTQMLSFYYPDDEGLWGLNIWGNYSPNVNPARQDYINNIQGLRNDGDVLNDDVRYQFRMTNERLPLIIPYYDAAGAPVTDGNGHNLYYHITNLKSYNYLTLTTKIKLDKWFNLAAPLDASFFMTDNVVSGTADQANSNGTLPAGADPAHNTELPLSGAIPNLFEQRVFSGALMVNLVADIDLLGDIGVETWHSAYTYPKVDYTTNEFGLGVAYDIPWCGGKMECRYKHIDFHDKFVANNDYSGDQFFTKLKFMF
ncbi:MAG TPA: hypothetical protein VMU88_08095 [bacterium]|nr:hypothetical protein [bacterium]